MSTRRLILALALALAGGGCRPPPHAPTPCPLRARAEGSPLEAATALPAGAWFDLLAPDHARARDPWAELHECSNQPLDGGPAPASRILPHAPPGAADLSFAAAPGGDLLVWARVVRYDDGDALGPIALIHRHEEHLEVTAVGSLRAPAGAPSLRLEAPEGGPPVAVAEGDRCVREGVCAREAQLVPLLGHRFMPLGIAAADGSLAPARIVLEEAASERLADGWVRETMTRRRIAVRDGALVVRAVTRIRECPEGLAQACEEQAAVDREETLELADEAWVVTATR